MPGNTKTPVAQRKKVTASAHAHVSTRKVKKTQLDQEDSFICQPVSTVSTSSPTDYLPPSSSQSGSNDALLSILTQIQASNQQLADRMSKLEQQQLFNLSSHTTDHRHSVPTSTLHLTILTQDIWVLFIKQGRQPACLPVPTLPIISTYCPEVLLNLQIMVPTIRTYNSRE